MSKKLREPFYETKYWFVVVAEEQTYLGYCIVVLKRRDCGDLALITSEELLDFHELVKNLQSAIRKTFGATMFNWTCLMNNAYQEEIPKPHVHWHLKPRYDHPVEFEGETFIDPNFGHHYIRLDDLNSNKPSEAFCEKIGRAIKNNLD